MTKTISLWFVFLWSSIAFAQNLPTVVPLEQRLAEQVQRMIDAEHLAPAFAHCADHYEYDSWPNSNRDERTARAYYEFDDYFHNPAETIYTLAIAIPFLPVDMQATAKAYMQSEFNLYPPHTYMHMGPTGARREKSGLLPKFSTGGVSLDPADPENYAASFGIAPDVRTDSEGMPGYSFNPFNIYACWKYAQTMELNQSQAANLVSQFPVGNKVKAIPNDAAYLQLRPYILNQYIAGYYGYLGLQEMAGQTKSATVQGYLDAALQQRLADLNAVNPTDLDGWEMGGFLYIVPELGEYFYQNAKAKAQAAWDTFNWAMPYWMMPLAPEVFRYLRREYVMNGPEGEGSDIYCHWGLFQGAAYALKFSRVQLEEYIHGSALYRGDLYYIQNLVAAIRALPLSETPSAPTNLRIVQ